MLVGVINRGFLARWHHRPDPLGSTRNSRERSLLLVSRRPTVLRHPWPRSRAEKQPSQRDWHGHFLF
jgi:hypothetical protein